MCDELVDGPLEFGVFLAGGHAGGQRDSREHDDDLPAPERERCQPVREQAHVRGPLHHVVRAGEQRRAAEGEDDRVGVQGAQAPVRQPGGEIELRPVELRGDEHAHRHPDDAPHDGHDGELPHHLVVVGGEGNGGRAIAQRLGGDGGIHAIVHTG
jgi:hypothetical protein